MKKSLLTASVASLAAFNLVITPDFAQAAILDKTTNPFASSLGLARGGTSCAGGLVEGASECVGSFVTQGGNNDVTNGGPTDPASQILASGILGGITNWTFNAKRDLNDNGTQGTLTGSNPLGFSISTNSARETGTFSFSNINLALTNLAISLKGGPSYSIYYIKAGTLTSATGIDWNTLGIQRGNGNPGPGLSHASVYYNVIPTPALLPGLIGMGVAAWRKRKGEVETSADA